MKKSILMAFAMLLSLCVNAQLPYKITAPKIEIRADSLKLMGNAVVISDKAGNQIINVNGIDRTPDRVLTTDANGVGRFTSPIIFNNGLTKDGNTVSLGGPYILNQGVNIYPAGGVPYGGRLSVGDGGASLLTVGNNNARAEIYMGKFTPVNNAMYGGFQIANGVAQRGIQIFSITDSVPKFYDQIGNSGLRYAGKYRTNLNNRSIVDKEYIDSVASNTGLATTSYVDSQDALKQDKITGSSLITDAEKTRLSGVQTGATANSTDAQLRDRTTHTGVQAINTITDLQSTLDAKPNLTTANTYTAGAKQTFRGNATSAGLALGGALSADPSSVTGGDIWYRSDDGKIRYRDGSTSRVFVTEALAQTLTNKTLINPIINSTINITDVTNKRFVTDEEKAKITALPSSGFITDIIGVTTLSSSNVSTSSDRTRVDNLYPLNGTGTGDPILKNIKVMVAVGGTGNIKIMQKTGTSGVYTVSHTFNVTFVVGENNFGESILGVNRVIPPNSYIGFYVNSPALIVVVNGPINTGFFKSVDYTGTGTALTATSAIIQFQATIQTVAGSKLDSLSNDVKDLKNNNAQYPKKLFEWQIAGNGFGKGAFFVYSQKVGNIYIRHKVGREINTADIEFQDYYRYLGCELVTVSTNKVVTVLNTVLITPQESEFVFRQSNSLDFSGGYHGNEKFTNMTVYVDGVAIDLSADIPLRVRANAFNFAIRIKNILT